MPVHDWTRVDAGTFHHFHLHWIAQLNEAIEPLLPPDYYIMAEQFAGELAPDLLALRVSPTPPRPKGGTPGTTAVATCPPPVLLSGQVEEDIYAARQRSLVVRHTSEDQIVAIIEVVSAGNKSSRDAIRAFRRKVVGALRRGVHLLILDLHPPGPRDPQGIHGLIWGEFSSASPEPPPGKPLTLAAYVGGLVKAYYVQPVGVGDVLPNMPLFLDPEEYVSVPLEVPYQAAFARVPRHLQRRLQE